MSDLVRAAARNNAAWCEAVCRSHGLPGRFGRTAWTNPRRTPPLYPDAVTLSPHAADPRLYVDASPGCTVKDSFADLDLPEFSVLFEATWIHHPPPRTPQTTRLSWRRITEAEPVAAWRDLFRADLLADPDVAFLVGRAGAEVVAGAVANRANGVVGLSNAFGAQPPWPGALNLIAATWPGLPVVGYEHGADLDQALDHGFAPIGPLRILAHRPG